MARLRIQNTNFTAGEISPQLFGRADLRAYQNGSAKLQNVFIHPTGGLSRRPGLRYVDTALGPGRLISFEFNTQQTYLLLFSDRQIDIYKEDMKIYTITSAPWRESQVAKISWTQTADTMLVVHPDVAPRKITREADGRWLISSWRFAKNSDRIFQPHHNFVGSNVTLKPSRTSGIIDLTASERIFSRSYIGTRIRIGNKELTISGYDSSTRVDAVVRERLSSTNRTSDWSEQAFSNARGWPSSICFHQDRMVIGGSRDAPNRLWISKSSDLFNFDLGEGLDDESIEFSMLSDQVNAIRAVFSGRHLQVFTSGAEWMITGSPLTPSNMQIQRQTKIGSRTDRTILPKDIDGASLFVPRDGFGIREFLFADMEQAYQATDVAMLARHMVVSPKAVDYNGSRRLFHAVLENGDLATVTIYRAEKVTAWTLQKTEGNFLSVAVVGETTYFLVERDGFVFIERLDDALNVDSGIVQTAESPKTQWDGLDHLEGRFVFLVADGVSVAPKTVINGAVTLDDPASTLQAGLPFSHIIHPLPVSIGPKTGGIQGAMVRPVSVTFRLQDTSSLRLDTGRGFSAIPFARLGEGVLDTAIQPFSGDKKVRAYGWRRDGLEPLWKIKSDIPSPFHLLSVATEIAVNG